MPTIGALGTAVPAHRIAQPAVQAAALAHFAARGADLHRYARVFDHARIATRYFVEPLTFFRAPHGLAELNQRYLQTALELGEQAGRACLAQASLDASDVQHVIWVSTTGIASPSPDATLIQRLGMDRHTRRTPIWGLGCAGGVAGLARAYEYTRAFPDQRALLIAAEICSLTFQADDLSPRNLVAAALFADGAAAALVEGDALGGSGPQIVATQSLLWPDTQDVMGWDVVDSGMRVLFGQRIPALVRASMRDVVTEFLAMHGLGLDDVAHWVMHPGGAKVIDAYADALTIDAERLTHTSDVLREYGNMSSVTVLFVLDRFLRAGAIAPGDHALLAVLGPGFSCELALLRG